MKKKGKMYKIHKREGENVYDVRRKVKGRIKRKDGKKEGGNVIKENLHTPLLTVTLEIFCCYVKYWIIAEILTDPQTTEGYLESTYIT